jgi:hypothetical protein
MPALEKDEKTTELESKKCVNIKLLILDAFGTSTTARNKGHLFYYPSLLNVPLSTLASLNLS